MSAKSQTEVLSAVRPVSRRATGIKAWGKRNWHALLVVALAVILWLPRLSGPIDLRYDAGVYYLLGTSLATGQGYRIPSEPGSPQALQYPPLLPAIVAAYELALHSTDHAVVGPWLRRSFALMFLAYALAVLALAKRFLPIGLATAAAVLCLLHHQTIFLSDLLFAELPFALVAVSFALVASKPTPAPRQWIREAGSFFLAAVGFLLRTAGLALLAAWVLEACIHRRWRLAIVRGALAVLPFFAWQGYVMHVRNSDEYAKPAYEYQRASYQYYNVSYAENALLVDPFRPELGHMNMGKMASRFLGNLPEIATTLGQAVTTTKVQWSHLFGQIQRKLFGRALVPRDSVLLAMLVFSGFVIAGLLLLVGEKAWLIVLIIVTSTLLVWMTPWPAQFSRYLAPLIPFLDVCFILAWWRFWSRLGRSRIFRQARLGQAALAGVLLTAFMMEIYTDLRLFRARQLPGGVVLDPVTEDTYRLFAHNPTWREWEKCLAWISARAPKDAIIATTAPHFAYLLTGHHAVLPPMEDDSKRAGRLLEEVPVSYVIIDTLEFLDISKRYALPAVKGSPAEWHLVHTVGDSLIYGRTAGNN